MDLEFEIVRKPVKYSRIEVRGRKVRVIVNKSTNPGSFIEKSLNWIEKTAKRMELERKQAGRIPDISRNEGDFRSLVSKYLNMYSKELNARVNSVRFKRMKSRWGSCSSNGNISVNRLMKNFPEELIRYVIYHETLHILYKDHGKFFQNRIASKFPNYLELDKMLRLLSINLL